MIESNTKYFTIAKSERGKLYHASEAHGGSTFHCPFCNNEMVLKRQKEGVYDSHFIHRIPNSNCSPKKVNKLVSKYLLFNRIDKALNSGAYLALEWVCYHCDENHNGNLLSSIHHIEMDSRVGDYYPEIVLFNKEGIVKSVIRIVSGKGVARDELYFYRENSIVLVEFKYGEDLSLGEYEKEKLFPKFVDYCFNPKCESCHRYLRNTEMAITTVICPSCGRPKKIALVVDKYGKQVFYYGPKYFSKEEIGIARIKGVLMERVFVSEYKREQLVNTCDTCGYYVLDSEVYDEYEKEENVKEYIKIGMHCLNCSLSQTKKESKER